MSHIFIMVNSAANWRTISILPKPWFIESKTHTRK